MALITDAYLGVTSEAGHLLFLSVLCSLLCLSAIQPQGKHMQKGVLQHLKRLSSQGAAAL